MIAALFTLAFACVAGHRCANRTIFSHRRNDEPYSRPSIEELEGFGSPQQQATKANRMLLATELLVNDGAATTITTQLHGGTRTRNGLIDGVTIPNQTTFAEPNPAYAISSITIACHGNNSAITGMQVGSRLVRRLSAIDGLNP